MGHPAKVLPQQDSNSEIKKVFRSKSSGRDCMSPEMASALQRHKQG